MFHRRITTLSVIALTVVLVTFVFSGVTPLVVCPLKVNAQDNPCLQQDATISAYKLQIIDLQSTITSMSSSNNASALIPTNPAHGANLPFEENWVDNSRGWDLRSGVEGGARLSQGGYVLTSNKGNVVWRPIPNLKLDGDYYVEVTVTPLDDRFIFIGFGFGDSSSQKFHIFGGAYWVESKGATWYIDMFDQNGSTALGDEILQSKYDSTFWSKDSLTRLGMEYKNGLYTFYLGNTATETMQINPYGEELGLAVRGVDNGSYSAKFTNLVVRDSR